MDNFIESPTELGRLLMIPIKEMEQISGWSISNECHGCNYDIRPKSPIGANPWTIIVITAKFSKFHGKYQSY